MARKSDTEGLEKKVKIDFKSHKKYNSIFADWIIDDWKKYQCDACRNGDRSKCNATREGAAAFREDHKGKMHYYCFMGCLMLYLIEENVKPEEIKRFIESQFNRDGHYEKLARMGNDCMKGRHTHYYP